MALASTYHLLSQIHGLTIGEQVFNYKNTENLYLNLYQNWHL